MKIANGRQISSKLIHINIEGFEEEEKKTHLNTTNRFTFCSHFKSNSNKPYHDNCITSKRQLQYHLSFFTWLQVFKLHFWFTYVQFQFYAIVNNWDRTVILYRCQWESNIHVRRTYIWINSTHFCIFDKFYRQWILFLSLKF